MESLTSYGYSAHITFIFLSALVLITESIALFWGATFLGRQRFERVLPEAAALGILLSVTLVFGGSWSLFVSGLMPYGWMTLERCATGGFAIVMGFCLCRRRPWLGVPLAAAGLLSLPLFDRLLPWSALFVLILLAARLAILACAAPTMLEREVTVASIREGLDLLPEGILFARENGAAVLVNIQMLAFMERLLGQQFRSAAIFWQALIDFDHPTLAEKEVRDDAILFRFSGGDSWLVQRIRLMNGLSGWQLTASCVTELDAVTRELEAKNARLSAMISAQKDLLDTLEETERHRTLQEITSRVHDVLGQRISMLQQLLASPAPKDALDTIVRIDSLLEAVPLTQEAHPATLLADMTDTYRSLGVRLTLSGSLPRNMRRARAFAAIIREALSNAVCHGRANEIVIALSERRLHIRDNGIGCTGKLRPGGGLTGMMRRVNALGGRLIITPAPHFELDAQIGEKQG